MGYRIDSIGIRDPFITAGKQELTKQVSQTLVYKNAQAIYSIRLVEQGLNVFCASIKTTHPSIRNTQYG